MSWTGACLRAPPRLSECLVYAYMRLDSAGPLSRCALRRIVLTILCLAPLVAELVSMATGGVVKIDPEHEATLEWQALLRKVHSWVSLVKPWGAGRELPPGACLRVAKVT